MNYKVICPGCEAKFNSKEVVKWSKLIYVNEGGGGLWGNSSTGTQKYLMTCNTCELSFYVPLLHARFEEDK